MPTDRLHLVILVFDQNHEEINEATVILDVDGAARRLSYNRALNRHEYYGDYCGNALLTVEATGFESQTRQIVLGREETMDRFYLGRPGDRYTYFERRQHPYTMYPCEIGLFGRFATVEDAESLKILLEDDGVVFTASELDQIGREGFGTNKLILSMKSTPDSEPSEADCLQAVRACLQRLRNAGYGSVGPIFRTWNGRFSIFINQLDVTFIPRTPRPVIEEVLSRHGLHILREADSTGCRLIVEAAPDTGYELNETLGHLLNEPLVSTASAATAALDERHAFPEPTNFLWPSLWDRKLVGSLEAWQKLKTAFNDRKAHGDPNIVMAVVDDGITSSHGIPKNEDFKGNITYSAATTLAQSAAPPIVEVKLRGNVTITNTHEIKFDKGLEEWRGVDQVLAPDAGHPNVTRVMVKGVMGIYEPESDVLIRVGGTTTVSDAAKVAELVEPVASKLYVNAVDNFEVGQAIVVGEEGDTHPETEIVIILGVSPDSNDKWFLTTPVMNPHASGAATPVVFGRKLYAYADFQVQSNSDPIKRNNDDVVFGDVGFDAESNHGVSSAGVAAAKADTEVDGRPFGIVGVAPNARLIGVLRSSHRSGNSADGTQVFPWITGIIKYDGGHPQNTLLPLPHGADVVNHSIGGDVSGRDTYDAMIRRIVRRGRFGRGTILMYSAGNDHRKLKDDDTVSTYGVFAVAASTLLYDENTQKTYERFANYSNFSNPAIGDRGLIDWCAPSGANVGLETSPPLTHMVITADFPGKGSLPGSAEVDEPLGSTNNDKRIPTSRTGDYVAGETKIKVNNKTALAQNKFARIGGVGDDQIDWIEIQAISTTDNTITLKTPLLYDHISNNVEVDIVGTVDASSPATITDEFVFNIPVATQAARMVDVKEGGLIKVTINGTPVVRRIKSRTYINASKYTIKVDEPYPVAPNAPVPTNPVVIPKNKNISKTVIRETTIEVTNNANYDENRWILVGAPGLSKSQAVFTRKRLSGSTDLSVSGLIDQIPSNARVIQGRNDYYDHFSGTSSAAPIASGVAALVLSAKPTLTWLEIEEIMKATAVKIDLTSGLYHHTADLGANDFRWFDGVNRTIVGIQEDFVLKGRSTTVVTALGSGCSSVIPSAGAGAINFSIANAGGLTKGMALSLTSAANPAVHERVIVESVNGCIVVLESPLQNSYVSGDAAVSGIATASQVNGTKTIVVNSAESFVIGQEIQVAVSVGGAPAQPMRFTIADLPSDTEIVTNETIPGTIATSTPLRGGRVPSLYITGVKSQLDGNHIPPDKFKVDHDDIWFFEEGNLVLINKGTGKEQTVYVKSVDTATNEVTVCAVDGSPVILNDHLDGDDVRTGWTEISSGATSPIGTDTITVDDPGLFVEGQVIRIDNDVLTVITKIDGNVFHLRPKLTKQVGSGDDVVSGRKPVRNLIYGAGRLDAEKAVERALGYTHNQRDLMIRSFATDGGTTPIDYLTQAVESPDIWIQHADHGVTAPAKVPPEYIAAIAADSMAQMDHAYTLTENLHETVAIPDNKDVYIYARIRNRGEDYAGLRSRVRFYVYRTLAKPPFRFPQTWDDTRTLADLGPEPGTYLIDEIELFDYDGDGVLPALNPDASGHGKGGIKAGFHYIVRAKWPNDKFALPGAGDARFHTYIIVEITPHDGVVMENGKIVVGDRVGRDNNIAMRAVSFASVNFNNANPGEEGAVPKKVKPNKSPKSSKKQSFRFEVRDRADAFRLASLEIRVRRTKATDSDKDDFVATYDGTSWLMPSQSWFSLDAPKLGGTNTTANPALLHDSIDIAGYFKYNVEDKEFDIDLRLREEVEPDHVASIVMESGNHIEVETSGTDYDTLKRPGNPVPQFHAPVDPGRVVAAADGAYGRISNEEFRITSGFEVTAGQGDACVYAATTGFLMIQHVEVEDAPGYDEELVNVVIKPLYQSGLDFAPAKYFVYRGLRLSDFLDVTPGQSITQIRAKAGGSEFITALYEDQEDRILYFREKHGTNNQDEPPGTPSSAVLGWQPSLSSETMLDDAFRGWSDDQGGGNGQLPFVKRGTCIGTLAAGAVLGFEVVVEDGTFHPGLAYARASEYVISVPEDLPDDEQRHRRDSILSFVDPAAYVGMHVSSGVYQRTALEPSAVKKNLALYEQVMGMFATKNRVYLDVRNENGYSLNFYGNYQQDEGNLKIGDADELDTISYEADGWPLVAVDRAATEGESLFVSLPYADNPRPVVYLEHAEPTTQAIDRRFLADGYLITEGETWTKRFGLRIPQVVDDNEERQDVSTVLKLHYARGVESTRPWTNDDPVPKFQRYTDNVFGPVNDLDALIPWKTGSQIKTSWASLGELKYVDGLGGGSILGFGVGSPASSGGMVERGVACHQEQIVFYNSAVAFMNVDTDGGPIPIGKGADGGFSPRSSFTGSSSLFNGLRMESVSFTDSARGSAAVTATRFVSVDDNALPESLMMLGLTQAQFAALDGVAGQLSDKHERNIALVDPAEGPTGTWGSVSFKRRKVVLRGLDPATLTTKDVSPSSAIVVYSVDGLTFVPDAFTMPELVKDEYEPTGEERMATDSTAVDALIGVNTAISGALTTFDGALQGISATDTTAKAQLITATQTVAQALLSNARSFTLSGDPTDIRQDDQPLFWGRLQAAVKLQNHAFLRKNLAARTELMKELEEISRGYRGVDFSTTTYKKILITGYDPFDRDGSTGLPKMNPSGVVALALHGTLLENPDDANDKALVQAVIFPVRYAEFDAGFIEQFFKTYLYDDPVQMIVTISQNGGDGYFNIERFAARIRSGYPDNNDQTGLPTVGVGSGWAEFYETTLPTEAMMADVDTGDDNDDQLIFFNQSITALKNDGTSLEVGHPRQSGPDMTVKDTSIPVDQIKEVYDGSGGNFLSNEIFYRVAHLRQTPPSTSQAVSGVLTGHLHIPAAEYTSDPLTMKQILDRTRELLANAIGALTL